MRLFFAVPVKDRVTESVVTALKGSPAFGAPLKWVDPGNYHLTLRFLGETDERLLSPLVKAGRDAAKKIRPFEIRFGRIGGFPDLRRPRVIFCGVEEGKKELSHLAASLDEEIEYLGFEREKRPYRAHLTLARVKDRIDSALSGQLESIGRLPEPAIQIVDRFVLMRSVLSRAGASYTVLDEFVISEADGKSG